MENTLTVERKPIADNSIEFSCRDRSERLYPECEWEDSFLFSQAIKSEHPFLQKLIDYKGLLTNMMGEWVYLAYKSMVMLHVYDGFVNIECISTPHDMRGQGSGKLTMQALVQAAKETGTELRLRACNVTGNGWNMAQHPVIANGMKTKGKIPTAKLQAWYEKFGFEKVATVIYRGKKQGVNMILKP